MDVCVCVSLKLATDFVYVYAYIYIYTYILKALQKYMYWRFTGTKVQVLRALGYISTDKTPSSQYLYFVVLV